MAKKWSDGYTVGLHEARPKPPPFMLLPSLGVVTESILQQHGILSNSFPSLARESIIITDARRILLPLSKVADLIFWASQRLGPSHPVAEGNTCVEHAYRVLGLWCSNELRGVQPLGFACGLAWYPHHVCPIALTMERQIVYVDPVYFRVQARADVPERVEL